MKGLPRERGRVHLQRHSLERAGRVALRKAPRRLAQKIHEEGCCASLAHVLRAVAVMAQTRDGTGGDSAFQAIAVSQQLHEQREGREGPARLCTRRHHALC